MYEEAKNASSAGTGIDDGTPANSGVSVIHSAVRCLARQASGGPEQVRGCEAVSGDGHVIPPVKGAYIYVMEASKGLQKIGISGDPDGRLRGLKPRYPHLARVAFARPFSRDIAAKLEIAAHAKLADHRVQRDWFAVSLEQAIKAVNDVISDFSADREAAPELAEFKMIRTKQIATYLFPEAWDALDKAAKADGRTLSQYVERIIVAHLSNLTAPPPRTTPQ